jgi:hypothetical protein
LVHDGEGDDEEGAADPAQDEEIAGAAAVGVHPAGPIHPAPGLGDDHIPDHDTQPGHGDAASAADPADE